LDISNRARYPNIFAYQSGARTFGTRVADVVHYFGWYLMRFLRVCFASFHQQAEL
jgi:hypothetical protein